MSRVCRVAWHTHFHQRLCSAKNFWEISPTWVPSKTFLFHRCSQTPIFYMLFSKSRIWKNWICKKISHRSDPRSKNEQIPPKSFGTFWDSPGPLFNSRVCRPPSQTVKHMLFEKPPSNLDNKTHGFCKTAFSNHHKTQ